MKTRTKKARQKYSPEGVHLFTIEARPTTSSKKERKYGGAFINCWINFRLYEGALALAKFYIRENGWRVVSIDKYSWVNGPSDVVAGQMRFYREARKDGISLVYNVYPRRLKNGDLTNRGTGLNKRID